MPNHSRDSWIEMRPKVSHTFAFVQMRRSQWSTQQQIKAQLVACRKCLYKRIDRERDSECILRRPTTRATNHPTGACAAAAADATYTRGGYFWTETFECGRANGRSHSRDEFVSVSWGRRGRLSEMSPSETCWALSTMTSVSDCDRFRWPLTHSLWLSMSGELTAEQLQQLYLCSLLLGRKRWVVEFSIALLCRFKTPRTPHCRLTYTLPLVCLTDKASDRPFQPATLLGRCGLQKSIKAWLFVL